MHGTKLVDVFMLLTISQSHWYKTAKCYLRGGKETAWWAVPTHPLPGQLFGVSVLQVAAEDLSGCGEALVCKAQHYCSAKRNVIGIWD